MSDPKNKSGMETLLKDAEEVMRATRATRATDGDFVRGLIVFETRRGNFLTITRGDDMEAAANAACVAMGMEPDDD